MNPGKCKFCGCTETSPCVDDGEPCGWVIFMGQSRFSMPGDLLDPTDNVCSSVECVEEAHAEAKVQI